MLPMPDMNDDGILLSSTIKENVMTFKEDDDIKHTFKKIKMSHLSGILKEKGNTCLPLPITSVPGRELLIMSP